MECYVKPLTSGVAFVIVCARARAATDRAIYLLTSMMCSCISFGHVVVGRAVSLRAQTVLIERRAAAASSSFLLSRFRCPGTGPDKKIYFQPGGASSYA